MKPEVILQTERIRLHPLDANDAERLYELDSDPEVMKFLTRGQPTPLQRIREEILPRWIAFHETSQCFGYWAAVERSSDEFIGWFHFRPHKVHPEDIELGYRLRRRSWSLGYATEVCLAIIRQAFTEWNVDHIVAATLASNTASRRVMEKCGMQLEEEFEYDERSDWPMEERQSVKYGIYRHPWLADPSRQA